MGYNIITLITHHKVYIIWISSKWNLMEITLVAPYQISFDHNVSYRLLCSIENCCKSEPLIELVCAEI